VHRASSLEVFLSRVRRLHTFLVPPELVLLSPFLSQSSGFCSTLRCLRLGGWTVFPPVPARDCGEVPFSFRRWGFLKRVLILRFCCVSDNDRPRCFPWRFLSLLTSFDRPSPSSADASPGFFHVVPFPPRFVSQVPIPISGLIGDDQHFPPRFFFPSFVRLNPLLQWWRQSAKLSPFPSNFPRGLLHSDWLKTSP